MTDSPLSHVNLHYVDSFAKAEEFMRWLGERRNVLGVDTETSGFAPEREHIRLVQFGDLDAGWAIPWQRWSGIAVEALAKYDGPLVLHNSKFDSRFIVRDTGMAWPWDRTNDTMTMAHLLDPQRPKGLKPLSAIHVDRRAAQAQSLLDEAMKDHKWTWATVPIDFPYYWMYAALDPVLTCHLYEKFKPQIDHSYKYVYELEMGTTRIVAAMEARGARVDLAYCDTKQKALMQYSEQARDWLMHAYGIVNATSNPQVIAALKSEGIEFTKLTAGGGTSLDKEVLESIDHPIAETVLNIRRAEKTVGPYFKNFLEMADADDRLHCNVWTMGTRTARMSITDPALQTLPRKDPTVRTAFIPSEDHVLITCDYDQIEARLTAHFSEDPGLIAAFGTEDDFFCTIAGVIWNEPISKGDPRRQLTKNTVYGKIYGAGAPTMARSAKVPVEQMEHVVSMFDARFPGVTALQRRVHQVGMQRRMETGTAYIMTPTGRYMVADDDKEYTLVNYLIQCHAAEILKRKMQEIDAVGMGDYLILPVHDELVFDVPADQSSEALHLIQATMADTTSYAVPITASGDILTSDWGEKYRHA